MHYRAGVYTNVPFVEIPIPQKARRTREGQLGMTADEQWFSGCGCRELSRNHCTRTRLQRPPKMFFFFYKYQVMLRS
jgi:hypothetical protein